MNALMEMIDLALGEADKIEKRLTQYDNILLHVKDSIEKMSEKNFFIEQTNANNKQLLDSLTTMLVSHLCVNFSGLSPDSSSTKLNNSLKLM